LVDEISHILLPRRDILSWKAQDMRAILLALKKLTETMANAQAAAMSHRSLDPPQAKNFPASIGLLSI
jgi:hypothetical protein